MSASEMFPVRSAGAGLARPVELICVALVMAHAVYLAASYWTGAWLIGPDGGGIPTDFVNVWAAGKLALDGHAAAAYDWPTHKAMEEVALGRPFEGYFGWHYPPTFLFAAAGLALLPYTAAYVLWTFGTFPAYLAAIRAIVGDRTGYVLAAAFPAVLCNFVVGQNGFLSAALLGGALVLLVRRPVLAGVCLGLLTYKPHLGIVIPIALIAGGHWRACLAAGAVAGVMAVTSWAAFGTDSWHAFIGNISHTSQAFLSDGWADFGKLQTSFGLARTMGLSEATAWSIQGAVVVVAVAAVTWLWRSNVAYELKAAALAAAALLATPYLYTYDLVVLAVPLAFLFRFGQRHGFLEHEMTGIGIACGLVLIFPFVTAPVGLAAIIIVAGLIARRAITSKAQALSLA
ncbi:MAG: glycosyltransferase family 87 protein [Pseudolabrys sp.]|nr:glycosyltransferase family 87 protein [Pseudolabrys sp.]